MKLKEFFKSRVSGGESVDDSRVADGVVSKIDVEEKILRMLKTVYDPEIPVNIYDLGLVYKIDLHDDYSLDIDMTMTAPNCPAADFIVEDVHQKLMSIDEVRDVNINLVFYPEWSKDMMSDEAKLELNML